MNPLMLIEYSLEPDCTVALIECR